jgi:hypothetical protein
VTPSWVDRVSVGLYRLRKLESPGLRRPEIYGAVTLGGLILLLIAIRLLTR